MNAAPRPRVGPVARGAAALVAGIGLSGGAAAGFLDSINPFADTKDAFEGKFIDSIEPRAWQPPLERLEAERARQRPARSGFNRGDGETETFATDTDPPPDREAEDPVAALADGLLLLRMDQDSVLGAPGAEAYLNGIGARLLKASPIRGAPVRYYLVANDGYGAAVALPDGAIAVPLGLLRQAESEDELAFILAHEAGHVLLEHHDNDWFKAMNERIFAAGRIALSTVAEFAQQVQQTGLGQDAAMAALASEIFLEVADKGLFPSFTREQEDEADLIGFDLVARAGYNPQGAFDAMQKMMAWEEYVASLPDPLAAKREALEAEASRSAERGDLETALTNLFSSIGLAGKSVADDMATEHRSAEARETSLIEYFVREYEEFVPPNSTAIALNQLRNAAEFQAIVAGSSSARLAIASAQEGRLDEAETMARAAVTGAMEKDSLARFAFYLTRLKQGRMDKARQNLDIALRGPRPTLLPYRHLAELYWQEGRPRESMEVLRQAFDEFKKPIHLYPDLIYRNVRLGDLNAARRLAIECKLRSRRVGQLCDAAAEGRAPELGG